MTHARETREGASGTADFPAAHTVRMRPPASAQPENLRQRLADGDLVTVAVLAPTRHHGWHPHFVPASRFLEAADNSSGRLQPLPCPHVPASASAVGAGGTLSFLDTHLIADLSTLHAAPWSPGTAVALADAGSSSGRVHASSPRHLLEAAAAHLGAYEVELSVRVRTQFRLTSTPGTDVARDFEAVLVHLCGLLSRAGLPVDSISAAAPAHTAAHDEHTVTAAWSPCDPLTACDNHVLHSLATTIHARQHGFQTASAAGDRLTLGIQLNGPHADIRNAYAGVAEVLPRVAAIQASAVRPLAADPCESARARTVTPASDAISVSCQPSATTIALDLPASERGLHETMGLVLTGIARGLRNRLPCAASPRTRITLPNSSPASCLSSAGGAA